MGFIGEMIQGWTQVPGGNAQVVLSRIPPEDVDLQAKQDDLIRAFREAGLSLLEVDSIYDQYETDVQIDTLRQFKGDLIFLGWHYPRALKWILARHHIEINDTFRKLHCLDVREMKTEGVVAKVRDILGGRGSAEVKTVPKDPTHDGLTPRERGTLAEKALPNPENAEWSARWYPVVDYDACTNCMECLDFCLFGVYGVDHAGTLRVVQQDECRTDCPACSRVCPVGAIVFPKYKTNQSIAGGEDDGERGSLKLNLSKIFGKPKARHTAALERDRELIKAGRQPASAEKIDRLAEEFDQVEI